MDWIQIYYTFVLSILVGTKLLEAYDKDSIKPIVVMIAITLLTIPYAGRIYGWW